MCWCRTHMCTHSNYICAAWDYSSFYVLLLVVVYGAMTSSAFAWLGRYLCADLCEAFLLRALCCMWTIANNQNLYKYTNMSVCDIFVTHDDKINSVQWIWDIVFFLLSLRDLARLFHLWIMDQRKRIECQRVCEFARFFLWIMFVE